MSYTEISEFNFLNGIDACSAISTRLPCGLKDEECGRFRKFNRYDSKYELITSPNMHMVEFIFLYINAIKLYSHIDNSLCETLLKVTEKIFRYDKYLAIINF